VVIAQAHAWDRNQPRRVPLAQVVHLLGPLGQLAPRPRPYNFLATISCSTCRSRLRSATSRFNFEFSSRN
jgi:hypothetical protein